MQDVGQAKKLKPIEMTMRNAKRISFQNGREDAYMKEIQLDIEKSKAERKGKLDVAKKLKAQGMDEAMIKQVTGLRLHEIRKL